MPQIPFEVILAILFFVLPAVGNLLKKRNEGAERQRKADTQKTEPQKASTPSRLERPQTPAQGSTTQPGSPSQAEDWLEQARRRVAEAQGRETGSGRTSPSSPPLVKPRQSQPQTAQAKRPVTRPASDRPRQGSAGRSLETRKPEPRFPEARSLESRGREGSSLEGGSLESSRAPLTSLEASSLTGSLAAEAPPIRVQRLNRAKRATITEQELRFDAHDLVKGLIWHQVLSPPRSTLRRTRLSRRQR